MAETTPASWTVVAEAAERVRSRCWAEGQAAVSDVEYLAVLVQSMAAQAASFQAALQSILDAHKGGGPGA